MNLTLMSDKEILKLIASRAKEVRISHELRQSDLSERSAVPLSSIRVFERSGKISLVYLLKLLRSLSLVEELDSLFQRPGIEDLKSALSEKPESKQRVRKKRS
jgi:transcriptional regulator with XRE-family HTH domain